MAIRIITDSAADFTREELAAHNVRAVALQTIFGEETFLAGETLDRDAFWARLIGGENAKTSQPSPDSFLKVFEEAKEAGDEVVYIAISSGISGTMQSAMLARSLADYEPIYIVDSNTASAAQKILVIAACRLREEGKLSAAQIAEEIIALRSRVRLYANVDTLEYLARGGRISKAAASIGTLAQLKPQIYVSPEGKVEVFGKAIGRHRAIDALVKKITSFPIQKDCPVIPVYSYASDNAEAFMKKLEKEGVSCDAHLLTDLGATIATHVGPNAYGLAFIEKA